MISSSAVNSRPRAPKWLIPTLGFAVSLISLWLVFRRFDFDQLARDVRSISWPWVAAAVAAELLCHVVDAWRWLVILSPAERPTLLQAVQATFIGMFANDVLPAKAGEIIRPYLLTTWARVPLSLSITSAVIERIFDGITLVIIFFLTADLRNVYPDPFAQRWKVGIEGAIWTMTVVMSIITVGLLFVLFYKSHSRRVMSSRPWMLKFRHLLDELHTLGHWQTLAGGFALSFVYFGCQITAFECLAKADGYDLSVSQAAFVLIVVRLGTLIPNAPGNLGSFQLMCQAALRMVWVEKFNSGSLANIIYVFTTAPAAIVGFIAVGLTGLSIGEIHKQAYHAHRKYEELRGGSTPELGN